MKLATLLSSFRRGRASENRRSSGALEAQLRVLQRKGKLDVPLVGGGQTSERHRALLDFGRQDLSLGRVVEAHTDATAILAEAGHSTREGALYGVWAADGPDSKLDLIESKSRGLVLRGLKRYCSGSSFLDAALVTAHHGEELLLIDIPLHAKALSVDSSAWVSPAFAATATGTVQFNDLKIETSQIVGGSRWYLTRPGFWHGAIGPAACWAGGAIGLVDAARAARRANPHGLAHLGALEAEEWGMAALLDRAGREIDADPTDAAQTARQRALSVRHLIERACTRVMDHFGRATGPALLAFDAAVAQRYAELTLYIRQCHAERDLESLAAQP